MRKCLGITLNCCQASRVALLEGEFGMTGTEKEKRRKVIFGILKY